MTAEKLCNDGRCKRIRMGEDRHEIHDIKNEKPRQWIIPEKAIKNMKKITVTFVILALALGFLVQIVFAPPLFLTERGVTPLFSQENKGIPLDMLNVTTLVIEIIFGIFIALVVYVYSKKMHTENEAQQKEIKNLIQTIEKMEHNQEQFLNYQLKKINEREEYAYFVLLSTLGILKKVISKLREGKIREEIERNEQGETTNFNWIDVSKEYLRDLESTLNQYSDTISPKIRNEVKNVWNVLQSYEQLSPNYEVAISLIETTLCIIEKESGMSRGNPTIFYTGLDGEKKRAL